MGELTNMTAQDAVNKKVFITNWDIENNNFKIEESSLYNALEEAYKFSIKSDQEIIKGLDDNYTEKDFIQEKFNLMVDYHENGPVKTAFEPEYNGFDDQRLDRQLDNEIRLDLDHTYYYLTYSETFEEQELKTLNSLEPITGKTLSPLHHFVDLVFDYESANETKNNYLRDKEYSNISVLELNNILKSKKEELKLAQSARYKNDYLDLEAKVITISDSIDDLDNDLKYEYYRSPSAKKETTDKLTSIQAMKRELVKLDPSNLTSSNLSKELFNLLSSKRSVIEKLLNRDVNLNTYEKVSKYLESSEKKLYNQAAKEIDNDLNNKSSSISVLENKIAALEKELAPLEKEYKKQSTKIEKNIANIKKEIQGIVYSSNKDLDNSTKISKQDFNSYLDILEPNDGKLDALINFVDEDLYNKINWENPKETKPVIIDKLLNELNGNPDRGYVNGLSPKEHITKYSKNIEVQKTVFSDKEFNSILTDKYINTGIGKPNFENNIPNYKNKIATEKQIKHVVSLNLNVAQKINVLKHINCEDVLSTMQKHSNKDKSNTFSEKGFIKSNTTDLINERKATNKNKTNSNNGLGNI